MTDIAHNERGTPGPFDPRVYLHHTAHARALQSEALGRMFGSAIGATGRLVTRTAADVRRRFTRALHKRRTITELSRLDDHLLADIGILRGQIPMIAESLIAPSGDAPRRTISIAPCPPEYRGDAANDSNPPSAAA